MLANSERDGAQEKKLLYSRDHSGTSDEIFIRYIPQQCLFLTAK
jgi:hypothetical protein